MLDKRNFYINGRWVAPATPRDCPVINPSTEEPCAVISLGSQADTDAAVAAAKAAFPAWAATPPARRAELVRGILVQYERRLQEFAEAISMEMGAPIDFACRIRPPACPGTPTTSSRPLTGSNGSARWTRLSRASARNPPWRWNPSASSA